MPKDLTVTALAMWGLFALGVIVGTCYCYYSDNHIDEKLGVSKGKIKLSAAIISGVFFIPAIYQSCQNGNTRYRACRSGCVFGGIWANGGGNFSGITARSHF